ncbi:MAG: anaerobic sulfite reductase subunit AsrA [Anaerovoracaceae bacterium]|jgi:anaerobic sulfite reductase subunit A
MGYRLTKNGLNAVLAELSQHYKLYAPHRFVYEGEHSDTDSIRYAEVKTVDQMELQEKSSHTFKEMLIPISETLFFFTEDSVKESEPLHTGAIIFLRSCDLHAVKRLDEIYLNNGGDDFYYGRLRDKVKFVLLGCPSSFENCFCVDMGTNISTEYDASLDVRDGQYYIDCKLSDWDSLLQNNAEETLDVAPSHVEETSIQVSLPESIDTAAIIKHNMWDEYDIRCIACGRCNFSCPTCTCFTMQDIFYTDNGKVGERRRVWASCMVDKFTDVAGGGSYRDKHGERMRFKVLHKVVDYNQRFGYHMCVGCGRCDDVCPEYISFSHAVNKLSKVAKEG